jgi:hypothetical protein
VALWHKPVPRETVALLTNASMIFHMAVMVTLFMVVMVTLFKRYKAPRANFWYAKNKRKQFITVAQFRYLQSNSVIHAVYKNNRLVTGEVYVYKTNAKIPPPNNRHDCKEAEGIHVEMQYAVIAFTHACQKVHFPAMNSCFLLMEYDRCVHTCHQN